MSLLSRSQLRIALAPDRVVLLRTKGLLRQKITATQMLPVVEGAEGRPWEPALQVLEQALPGFARKGEAVTLVLSSHFCRFLPIPALPTLASEEEEAAFARHTFREVYGEAAHDWTVRLSGDSPARPRLGAAIDQALLDGARRASKAAGLKLVSVQPFLMTAFNAWQRTLIQQPGWFALYEAGRLCLCLITKDGVQSVRGVPVSADWRAELPLLVQRESNLQVLEGQEIPSAGHVFHPSQTSPSQVRGLPANLQALTLSEHALAASPQPEQAAMALVGL